MLNRKFTILILIALSMFVASNASAQQDRSPRSQESAETVEFIRDYGRSTIVIRSRNQFLEHSKELFEGLGLSNLEFILDGLFKENRPGEMDPDKPIIFYRGVTKGTSITETAVKSERLLGMTVKDGEATKLDDWNEPLKLDARPIATPFAYLFAESDDGEVYGIPDGRQFAHGQSKKALKKWKASKFLKLKLPQNTLDVINQSGLSYIEAFGENNNPFDFVSRINESIFEGEEKKIAAKINALAKAGQFFIAGVTFEKETLEFNAHALFHRNDIIGQLFDLEKAKRPFRTTLGLPARGLIASVSANLEVLRSPSTVRVMAGEMTRIIEESFGERNANVDDAMVRLVGDLIAESWHEISAIRTGLYMVNEEKTGESMAVIAVIDPRQPEKFMTELSRFVTLIDKASNPTIDKKREAEVLKWISNLDSDSYQTRERATTRLTLAGNAAEPLLRKNMQEGTAEKRMRIQMILSRLDTNAENAAEVLTSDEGPLWSRIQPSYSLQLNADKIGNHSVHEIQMSVSDQFDAATKRRYDSEMRAVFGRHWSKIKLAKVGDQYVLMLGSSQELFEKALENVEQKKNPIQQTFAENKRRITDDHQLEINFSSTRIVNLLNYDRPERHLKPDDANISSVGLKIDERTWEAKFHLPVSEFKVWLNRNLFQD